MAFLGFFHGAADIAQLANAGGLHDQAFRMIGIDQIVDGLLEIARQGAADAAAVQLGDGDAGILHEAAVHAHFAVFIFQQDHFFALHGARDQLFDQRGFARAQETGNDVDFYHNESLLAYLAYMISCTAPSPSMKGLSGKGVSRCKMSMTSWAASPVTGTG